jgi:hypothetical protein
MGMKGGVRMTIMVAEPRTLDPQAVSLLQLLWDVGGCAPVAGLWGILSDDRKVAQKVIQGLEQERLLTVKPMTGDELLQLTAWGAEAIGQRPRPDRRLTYKWIRTGDLSVQYYVQFGHHLSAQLQTGQPHAEALQGFQRLMADFATQIGRKKDARDRNAQRLAKLREKPEATEKEIRNAQGKLAAAERELQAFRKQRTEARRANNGLVEAGKASRRLESLGVYRDPAVQGEAYVALDLGHLEKSLPEILQRCAELARQSGAPWRFWIWGVERAERGALEDRLAEVLEGAPPERRPVEAKVLTYVRPKR